MPRRLKIQKRTGLEFDMRHGQPIMGEEPEYKEPEQWTIITAISRVLDMAEDSSLSDEFWKSVASPLAYLREQLGLTNIFKKLNYEGDVYETKSKNSVFMFSLGYKI